MDEATRETVNTIYVALASAGGIGVLDEANAIITEAVASRSVRDPAAREALRHLVAGCGEPDTNSQLADAMANLKRSVGDLSAATGDDSLARITGHIARRVARITPSTPLAELQAIADMGAALDAALDRVSVSAMVDA
jgi:hypothetical protein